MSAPRTAAQGPAMPTTLRGLTRALGGIGAGSWGTLTLDDGDGGTITVHLGSSGAVNTRLTVDRIAAAGPRPCRDDTLRGQLDRLGCSSIGVGRNLTTVTAPTPLAPLVLLAIVAADLGMTTTTPSTPDGNPAAGTDAATRPQN